MEQISVYLVMMNELEFWYTHSQCEYRFTERTYAIQENILPNLIFEFLIQPLSLYPNVQEKI